MPNSPDAGNAGVAAADQRLTNAARAFSVESGFFLHAVSERLGMTATDFSCLTLLYLEGATTPGRLAERTGHTTGAITGVVDRLESQGWVRRTPDPEDRRRVIVEAVDEQRPQMAPWMAPMLEKARKIHACLTPEHKRAVARFLEDGTRMLQTEVDRLRSLAVPEATVLDEQVVPLGGLRAGELLIQGYVLDLHVEADREETELCRFAFKENAPTVQVDGGLVMVKAPRRVRQRFKRAKGRIALNADVKWTVSIRGGANRVHADLRSGQVSSISIKGGASNVKIMLPEPREAVPVTISGGASHIKLIRPTGVAVSVRARGGASDFLLDGRRLNSAGGQLHMSRPGEPGHTGRYEVELTGGASMIELSEG